VGIESQEYVTKLKDIEQFVVKEFKLEETPSIILPAVQMEIEICKSL